MLEVADADGAVGGQPPLDPVPRGVLEVEREPQARIERAEEELDRAVVPWALDRDSHRPEPVAERAHPVAEDVEPTEAAARKLGRELEALGYLLGPAAELLLRRQP